MDPKTRQKLQPLLEKLKQQSLSKPSTTREELRPVVAELREAGYDIDSIHDLYYSDVKLKVAIPILMKWLPEIRDRNAKDSIIRALSDRQAKGVVAPVLIEEFRKQALIEHLDNVAWAMGNALSITADDKVFDEIVELVIDKRFGRNREMLTLALANMIKCKDAAVKVLLELLHDEDVAGHAVMALGKLKISEARAEIEKFLTHEKRWIRTEAKRALAKIDKAAAKSK